MKAVIIGGGDVGLSLTLALEEQNINVTVIEKNEEVCENIASKTNATVIEGDGTDPSLLDTLSLINCDFFYAVTNDDPTNYLCAMYAKKSLVKRVFAKIKKPAICPMLNKLGIETVVTSAAISLELLNASLSNNINKLLNPIKSNLEVYEVPIPTDKELPLISEIEEKHEIDIFALYDGERFFVPDEYHQLAGMKSAIVIGKKKKDNIF